MFSAVLAEITIANGYHTDLGDRVYFGDPAEAAEKGRQALYFKPLNKSISVQNSRWEHRQRWEIIAISYVTDPLNNPELLMKWMERDIWKALGENRNLNGAVDNLSPAEDAVEYEIDTQGSTAVTVTIRVDLLRKTGLFLA
jgi:hypothetical protein